MKVKQEDGTEIEAFTAEEVEAQKSEALKAKEEELVKAKEDLSKLQDKDNNFKNLREQKEAAEKKAAEAEAGIKTIKDSILSDLSKKQVNEKIKSLSEGDAEMEKKIKFNFERIKDAGTSSEDVEKRIQDAFILSNGGKGNNALGGAISSAGPGITTRPFAGEKTLKPELAGMAKKFGITDKDVEEYYKNK